MFNGNTSVILGIWDLSSNELFCCSISPVWIFATPCTAPHCLLVLHYLLKFALTHVHVHWVNDAIHPSYPLLPPSPVLSLSQHQGLFQWVGSSHQVAKFLELHLQHQSFQWIFKVYILSNWPIWSPCSSRDSQKSSLVPQFQNISSLVLNPLCGPILTSICDY